MGDYPILKVFKHVHQWSIPFYVFLYPDHDISSMTVCMNKVVFHQHLKECFCPKHSDGTVQLMGVFNVKGDWESLGKGFY